MSCASLRPPAAKSSRSRSRPFTSWPATIPDQKELLDFLVKAFNREVEGLEGVEVWIHTCWGNPNMQKVFTDESYANSIEIYLERLKGDVWTIEATENDFKELPLFDNYKGSLKKKIAVGVISHRTLQADFPDVVAERIRRCLKHIPADKLVLSTDCGFGRQGFNRHLAFYKTVAHSDGAQHRAQGAWPGAPLCSRRG